MDIIPAVVKNPRSSISRTQDCSSSKADTEKDSLIRSRFQGKTRIEWVHYEHGYSIQTKLIPIIKLHRLQAEPELRPRCCAVHCLHSPAPLATENPLIQGTAQPKVAPVQVSMCATWTSLHVASLTRPVGPDICACSATCHWAYRSSWHTLHRAPESFVRPNLRSEQAQLLIALSRLTGTEVWTATIKELHRSNQPDGASRLDLGRFAWEAPSGARTSGARTTPAGLGLRTEQSCMHGN